MVNKELRNMPLTGLVMECMARGIPYKGEDAEALRRKLNPKRSAEE